MDNNSNREETLKQLGEKEILNRLKRFLPPGQIEDDTAQINPQSKQLLVNTDLLVEEVHFSEKTTSPFDIGWRATTANLSDLLASGMDEMIGITIGLVAPPNTSWSWVEGVYKGIYSALKEFDGVILGGDCSKGNQKALAITAFGTVGVLRIHRENAEPGDMIVVSGKHGLSKLGLELLLSNIQESHISENLKKDAIFAHQKPQAPLEALNTLKLCKPKGTEWRAGGTDSSDGLLEAVKNLCEASQCQAILFQDCLPKHKDWPIGDKWNEWCLNGGEDFELVLSIPKSWANAFLKEYPHSQLIGIMKEGPANIVWDNNKKINCLSTFKHF